MKCTLKYCIQWVSCVLVVIVPPGLEAQTVHISHCLAGCPAGAPAANEIVVRHLFAASINHQTGLADWVAYRVLPGSIGVASLLPREWQLDALLAQEPDQDVEVEPRFVQPDISNLQDRDYRITEVVVNPEDRGRLAPMSSFAGTPYWDDLNYLSNMAPIPVALRQGPWSRLDQAINELAGRIGEIYVLSGPLLIEDVTGNKGEISAGNAMAFFKFVATPGGNIAFVFPAMSAEHSGYCDRATSLSRLQELSGLELLPKMQSQGSDDLYGMLGCSINRNPE